MCRRINCVRCERPTYAGCGAHVEQVLRDVAPADRCRCREEQTKPGDSKHPAARSSWLRALLKL